MKQTEVQIHPAYIIGEVSPFVFGGFIEHIGRCVYEGLYDPKSKWADEHGFRTDVMAALRELDMTMMRYPGGNFVSGYHWQDGVGPKSERPTVKDHAWNSLESNHFGTDEFMTLCRKMNWEPMMAANLGTGTPEEARDWVEYCNSPAGSRFSDMRVTNGSKEPYGIKYWCLGNEMDGPWQIGHVPADQYAIRAQQAAKMMRDCDRSIQSIACGSSAESMPTFLEWDQKVLEYVGGLAKYVSLHKYVGNSRDDSAEYLAIGASIDRQIESVDACCRLVQAKRKSRRRAYLCFDEWNVWYKTNKPEFLDGKGEFAPHLNEEMYNFEDALVVAQFLNSFIRHADVVKIANLAQVVNVIAPLITQGEELLKQSIFHAFKLFSEHKQGDSLKLVVDGPQYESAQGAVPYLDCSAIFSREEKRITIFAVNRSVDESMPLKIILNQFQIDCPGEAIILNHDDLKATNDFATPDEVTPQTFDQVSVNGTTLIAELPAASLTRLVVFTN